jgi:hypothetical protein
VVLTPGETDHNDPRPADELTGVICPGKRCASSAFAKIRGFSQEAASNNQGSLLYASPMSSFWTVCAEEVTAAQKMRQAPLEIVGIFVPHEAIKFLDELGSVRRQHVVCDLIPERNGHR